MPSLFTRIIAGEIPGRFVWRDDRAVAFMTIAPLRPGHALVVPVEEIDHWIDVPADLLAHLSTVAQCVSKGIQEAFAPRKVGLMIAGLEVPHVHLHCVPIHEIHDLDFERQDKDAKPKDLDAAAAELREALVMLGYNQAKGTG